MIRKAFIIILLMIGSVVPVYLIETQQFTYDTEFGPENYNLVPEFVVLDHHQYPIEVVDSGRTIIIDGGGEPIIGFDIEDIESQVGEFSHIQLDWAPATIIENQVFGIQVTVFNSDNTIVRNNEFINVQNAIYVSSSENVSIESNIITTNQWYSSVTNVIEISLTTSNVYIYNNTIRGYSSNTEIKAIYAYNTQNLTVEENFIYDITTPYNFFGIYNYASAKTENFTAIGNKIFDISAKTFFGIKVINAENVLIKYNDISNIRTLDEYSEFQGIVITNSNHTYTSDNMISQIHAVNKFYGIYDYGSWNVTHQSNHISLIYGELTFFYGIYSYQPIDVNYIGNIVDKSRFVDHYLSYMRWYGIYVNNGDGASNFTRNMVSQLDFESSQKIYLYPIYVVDNDVFIRSNSIFDIEVVIGLSYNDFIHYGIVAEYDTGVIRDNTIYSITFHGESLYHDINFKGIYLRGNTSMVDNNYISDIYLGNADNPVHYVNSFDGIYLIGHIGFSSAVVTNNAVVNMRVVMEGTSSAASVINGFNLEEILLYTTFMNDLNINNNAVSNLNVTNVGLGTTSSYAFTNGFLIRDTVTVTSMEYNYISNLFSKGLTASKNTGINMGHYANNSKIGYNLIHLDNADKFEFNNVYNNVITVDTNTEPTEYAFSFMNVATYTLKLGASVISSGTDNVVLIDISSYTSPQTFTIDIVTTTGGSVTSTIYFDIKVVNYDLKIFGRLLSPSTVAKGDIVTASLLIFGDASSYDYTENGVSVDSGSWTSGQVINYQIDSNNYPLGVNSLDMTALDAQSNSQSLVFTMNIIDDIFSPEALLINKNDNFIEGTINMSVDWQVFDTNSGTFDILINGTVQGTGSYLNSEILTFSVSGISFGLWNITLVLTDSVGNKGIDTRFVNINKDIYNPLLSSPTSPTFLEYEDNSTGMQLYWTFSDLNPVDYQLLKNGTQIAFGPFNSLTTIYYDLPDLDIGFYNYTFTVFDINDNKYKYETTVHVKYDDVAPTISVTGFTEYEIDVTGNDLTLTLYDVNPLSYGVELDGTIYSNGTYVPGVSFDMNFDGLDVGVHVIKVYAYDNNNNVEVYVYGVEVTVDLTAPQVNGPLSVSFNEGAQFLFNFTYSDLHLWEYFIIVDDVLISQDYISGDYLTYDASHLLSDASSSQNYNVTLQVDDTFGNSGVHSTIVTVYRDQAAPLASSQPGASYTITTDGTLILNYTLTDANPTNYSATLGGVELQSGNWTSGVEVNIPISGLASGTHQFAVSFYDYRGASFSSYVSILVIEKVDPTVINLGDSSMTIAEGSTGNQITWQLNDDSPDYYEITVDSDIIETQSWSDNEIINFNIDSLGVGTHTVTITIYDADGNSASDSVTVIVEASASDPGNTDGEEPGEGSFLPGFQFLYVLTLFGMVLVVKRKKN